MRYLLLRKRRLWMLFVVLLITLSISLLAISSPRLLKDFKVYVQKRIARDFELEVDVGEVKGGLIRPLTFERISILRRKDDNFISFEAEALLPDCRIWDLILAQIFGYKEAILIISDGKLYLNSPEPVLSHIEGRIEIDGRQTARINLIAERNLDKLFLGGKIEKREKGPELDLKFSYLKSFARATFLLNGYLEDLRLEGKVFLLDEERIDFKSSMSILDKKIKFEDIEFNHCYLAEGQYDFENNTFCGEAFCFEEKKKLLSVDFGLTEEASLEEPNIKPFLLKLNFNHFNLFERDIVSFLEAEGNLFNDADDKNYLTFKLLTYGTIINHRPVNELEISCKYENGILNIISIHLGSELLACGAIDFQKQPPEIELVWKVNEMDLKKLLALSENINADKEMSLEGKLNGEICMKGSLFNPFIEIALSSKKGDFFGMKFESANINLEGNYPSLNFHDSRIYREEGGFFILDGKIDMKKMQTVSFFDEVRILSDEKTIILDGWDISRGSGQSEFTLKKAVSEDLKVGFKAFVNNNQDLMQNAEESALELEYKLQGNRSLLMRFGKDEEFFGLKHGVKF